MCTCNWHTYKYAYTFVCETSLVITVYAKDIGPSVLTDAQCLRSDVTFSNTGPDCPMCLCPVLRITILTRSFKCLLQWKILQIIISITYMNKRKSVIFLVLLWTCLTFFWTSKYWFGPVWTLFTSVRMSCVVLKTFA